MTPAEIIHRSTAAGLTLTMQAGFLRVTGPAEAVAHWRPVIAGSKAAILDILDPPPAGVTGELHRAMQAESARSVAFCFSHMNQQPDGHCPVKNAARFDLSACELWRRKCRGEF